MSCKSIVRELKATKECTGSISRRVIEPKHWSGQSRSYIAPDIAPPSWLSKGSGHQFVGLGLLGLLDIIRRVEESETARPARIVVVFCASVCRSWTVITKKIVETPEECGRLTFPVSLKQTGPRDSPMQCCIKRDIATSTHRLYFGRNTSEDENDKLLLAARKMNRAAGNNFVISLAAGDFSGASNAYVGELRSIFLRTEFIIGNLQLMMHFNILVCRVEDSMLSKSLQDYLHEAGTVPTPTSCPQYIDESPSPCIPKETEPTTYFRCEKLSSSLVLTPNQEEALVVKNKAPRWHEQMRRWCLDFKGRVMENSIKKFRLLAVLIDPSQNMPTAEQEKVTLQFVRIGRDIFVMD